MSEGGEWGRIVDAIDDDSCPIDGCDARVGRHAFLCAEHWRDVPDLLKGELRERAADTRLSPRPPDASHRWLTTAVEVVRVVEAA